MTDLPPEVLPNDHRSCLGCGYSLLGLGTEPRCPECGLLNIPDAYRRQVWELVDSGKWFFSGFFSPFRKRLPGWWWALDRDGDLKRAGKAACRNTAIALLIVIASYVGADACTLEVVTKWTSYAASDPTGPPHFESSYVRLMGHCPNHHTSREFASGALPRVPFVTKQTQSSRWFFSLRWHGLVHSLIICSWLVFLWTVPAMVGLWTQIRKGLPPYARAPRTILAATCYETHRLIYFAVVLAMLVCVETALRPALWGFVGIGRWRWVVAAYFLIFVTQGAFGAASWIGPVRSDYTQQLIRSRWHAFRFIVMYGLILPGALAGAAYVLIERISKPPF